MRTHHTIPHAAQRTFHRNARTPRRHARPLAAILLAVAAAVAAPIGCSAPTVELDRLGVAPDPLDEHAAALAAAALHADALYPKPGVRRFAAVAGFQRGVWWVEQTNALSPGRGAIISTRRLLDRDGAALATVQQATYEIDDDGAVLLRRLVDLRDDVELRFQPPVPVRPPAASLAPSPTPAEPLTWLGVVEQIDPATGDRTRTGTGRATTRLAAFRHVEPLGADHTLACAEIRTSLTIKLGPATVARSFTTWFAPNLGKLAVEENGNTRVIGVATQRFTHGLRRALAEE